MSAGFSSSFSSAVADGGLSTAVPVSGGDSHGDGGMPPPYEYRIPGYLIAVIVLSIILGVILLYKIYRHLSTKGIRITCCVQGPQGTGLQRSDTHKPLIKTSSSGSERSSVYRKSSQRNGPDMV